MGNTTQPDMLGPLAPKQASDGAPVGSGVVVSAGKPPKKNGHDSAPEPDLSKIIINAAGLTAADLATLLARAHAAEQRKDDGDFDWANRDDADIFLPRQPETAVYANPQNQVVIRQNCWPDDDAYVVFSTPHIPALLARIKEVHDWCLAEEREKKK